MRIAEALHALERGEIAMTRELMVEVLCSFIDTGPGDTIEGWELWQKRWLAIAKTDWINILFDLVINPPAERTHPFYEEVWDATLHIFLGKVGRLDPALTLQKADAFFTDDRVRPALISVIGGLGVKEGMQRVAPLVAQINERSNDEIIQIVDALGLIGGDEAAKLLQHIRNVVPADRIEYLHKDIDYYLKRLQDMNARNKAT